MSDAELIGIRDTMCVSVGVVCSTASPTADTMADPFRRHKPNTPRIPHERWEEFKPVLLEKCQTLTFHELARYMKREHNFPAK
jgi:hypothetical protein